MIATLHCVGILSKIRSMNIQFVEKNRQKKSSKTKNLQQVTPSNTKRKKASIFMCPISVLRSSACPQADSELKNIGRLR